MQTTAKLGDEEATPRKERIDESFAEVHAQPQMQASEEALANEALLKQAGRAKARLNELGVSDYGRVLDELSGLSLIYNPGHGRFRNTSVAYPYLLLEKQQDSLGSAQTADAISDDFGKLRQSWASMMEDLKTPAIVSNQLLDKWLPQYFEFRKKYPSVSSVNGLLEEFQNLGLASLQRDSLDYIEEFRSTELAGALDALESQPSGSKPPHLET